MQYATDDAERLVFNQLRQLQQAKRNYSVLDQELLAMLFALAKFSVDLLSDSLFIV